MSRPDVRRVFHIISGLDDGGAEAVLFRLCEFEGSAREITVVSLTTIGKYGPLLSAQGVRVTALGMPRGRVALGGLFQLWRLLIAARPDVVQTWMYHADLLGGLAARLAGITNVIWGIHHTELIPGKSSRSAILAACVCARLSNFIPKEIICCAEQAKAVHAKLGYASRKVAVIPNGYDLSTFRPDASARTSVRRQLALGHDAPIIGYVARYDAQKDHANLLEALRLLRERTAMVPTCLLVGMGMDTDNEALTQLIASSGPSDQVRLLGRRDDIPDILNAVDIHVMSSAFGEAFPNVLSEAMACGTPCVTTDVGDAAAIVGDTGWVVPPRNPEALADAIALALEQRDTPGWAARKAAAREHIVANYSIDRMVRAYHAVWST